MKTRYTQSLDGTRIAYDVTGTGVPIILLHGGGQTRRNWHDAGYVHRLESDFQVIAMDIRGSGESAKPTDVESYTPEKHCQDILAVSDACALEDFVVWGYSYGGNIGRYLAAENDRVSRFVMVGMPFGLGAPPDFRQFILDFRNHWEPILKARAEGTLIIQELSPEDQAMLQHADVEVIRTWLSALLAWPSVEPEDLLCPTLWVVGSRNESAMGSVTEVGDRIAQTKIELRVVDGLDHAQELEDVETVFPAIRAFLEAHER